MPIGATAGAAISGAASLGSAFIGSNAAKSAAQTQANAIQSGIDTNQQNLAWIRQQYAPYMTLGAGASGQLANLYGIPGVNGSTGTQPDYSAFYNSPDFKFAQQWGNQGVNNFLASTGQVQGSAGLNYVSQFNQGLASQQFGNYFGRLQSLAQLGAGATSGAAGASTSISQNNAQLYSNQGAALGGGIIGSANSWMGGLGGVGNAALLAGLSRGFGGQGSGSNSAYTPAQNVTGTSGTLPSFSNFNFQNPFA